MQTVLLTSAWAWTCPGCKHLNFIIPTVVTDPEVLASPEVQEGAELGFELLQIRDKAFCVKCEEQYQTEMPGDYDE